jgi:hypothetical protein
MSELCPTSIAVNVFDSKNVCMSGGAKGADLQWGMCAGKAGHQVIHWSFADHRTNAPEQEVVRIPEDLLATADEYLEVANKTLKRHLSYNKPWIINLLRRNYFQVGNSQSCYAVSSIKKGMVQGGTAWATQMYLDLHRDNPECYVFCQDANQWYAFVNSQWVVIETPPTPSGVWAGIGSRDLTKAGKDAIRALMGYVTPVVNN